MPKVYDVKVFKINVGCAEEAFQFNAVQVGSIGRMRKVVNVECPEKFKFLEVGTTKTGKFRLNISNSSEGWIAFFSSRGACGYIAMNSEALPHVEIIAKGWGAFSDARRTRNFDKVLIYTRLETFFVMIKGTKYYTHYYYFNNGNVLKFENEEIFNLYVDSQNITMPKFLKIKKN